MSVLKGGRERGGAGRAAAWAGRRWGVAQPSVLLARAERIGGGRAPTPLPPSDPPPLCRPTKKELTQEEAAVHVQRILRGRLARKSVVASASGADDVDAVGSRGVVKARAQEIRRKARAAR